MVIWRYMYATSSKGPRGPAYGTPVSVHLAGRRVDLIYQFHGGGQREAVVHPASGAIVAVVHDDHRGAALQDTAQAAVRERTHGKPHGVVWGVLDSAPVLNTVPEVLT